MIEKKRIIENLKLLAKFRKISFAEIEEYSGVSTGYFSRLFFDINDHSESNNKAERKLPTIDVFGKVCEKLDISIDTLINYDLNLLPPTEIYLILFIDKLLGKTKSNDIIWERIYTKHINPLNSIYNLESHPFLTYDENEYNSDGSLITLYFSEFLNKKTYIINDYYYSLKIKNRIYFITYILDPFNSDVSWVELTCLENGKYKKICRGMHDDSDNLLKHETTIDKMMFNLHSEVQRNSELNPNGVKLIDDLKRYFDDFNDN